MGITGFSNRYYRILCHIARKSSDGIPPAEYHQDDDVFELVTDVSLVRSAEIGDRRSKIHQFRLLNGKSSAFTTSSALYDS